MLRSEVSELGGVSENLATQGKLLRLMFWKVSKVINSVVRICDDISTARKGIDSVGKGLSLHSVRTSEDMAIVGRKIDS